MGDRTGRIISTARVDHVKSTTDFLFFVSLRVDHVASDHGGPNLNGFAICYMLHVCVCSTIISRAREAEKCKRFSVYSLFL